MVNSGINGQKKRSKNKQEFETEEATAHKTSKIMLLELPTDTNYCLIKRKTV